MSMPGDWPRLIDLTRLVSRSGRILTGVDRVELAYADALSNGEAPVWALVRTSLGFLLLDKPGVGALIDATRTSVWGKPDLLSRMSRKLDRKRQVGQSFARANAVARCLPSGLERLLSRHLPHGTRYFNVGHSNIDEAVFTALRGIQSSKVIVMIHDTIPLDFPDLQRQGTPEAFGHKLGIVGRNADLVLAPSTASGERILRHLGPGAPEIRVAHLGVEPRHPDPGAIPSTIDLSRPYFVVLGTIEPRKNHALLLDIWDQIGPKGPQLLICGRRGWGNEAVFERLDRGIAGVQELPDLGDGAVAGLLSSARGLLFPSLAEGFGLPAIEAAMLGCPVIASDLGVFRETLGDAGVYLPPTDSYSWKKTIEAFARQDGDRPVPVEGFKGLSWRDHFRIVLSVS